MTSRSSIVGIYDFELFPYALGDVLTWNVRTAMRCEELGRDCVDIHICLDEQHPAGIYQRGMVNPQNFELFFSELYGAFGTHPRLGDIHVFRQREALLAQLEARIIEDDVNAEAVTDYLNVLEHRVSENMLHRVRRAVAKKLGGNPLARAVFNRCLPSAVKEKVLNIGLTNEAVLNNYFIKYIHSHEAINKFAAERGSIPLLRPALGCAPDIDEIIAQRFAGKKVVPFHLRLRRLDAGYGGDHSYSRDSDFLEWYDFLRDAAGRHPAVQFVALGRLQEKPLELLRLPNVTSLRIFGMGLGHELTLMLKSDLFIGTSSGFAGMANFSSIPYFITKMTPGSCHAYAIPEGAERLPFAREDQKLIYERETSELLMSLLESRLGSPEAHANHRRVEAEMPGSEQIDIQSWLRWRSQPVNSAATTCRFYIDGKYRQEETAFLVLPNLARAHQALFDDGREKAAAILQRLEQNFPDVCAKLPQFLALKAVVVAEDMDSLSMRASLEALDTEESGFIGTADSAPAVGEAGWRPDNWIVTSGAFNPLPGEPQPALTIQAIGPNCYWHTERFIARHSGGRIVVRFGAKNSTAVCRHRMWIFEDGIYRSVGELVARPDWRTFNIPITTKPESILEFQIDQRDDSQWLSIRDFQVIGGGPLPLVKQAPVAIPMAHWTGEGTPCPEADAGVHDCRQWRVAGKQGYVQTPLLPQPGKGGLLIRFEARTDRPATTFTSIILFEGEKYRAVAQYAFTSEWRAFTLLLKPDRAVPIKIHVCYPVSVDVLSIRDFEAIPIDRDGTGAGSSS